MSREETEGTHDRAVVSMDYQEHERTYETFLWLIKWGVIHIATILVALAIATVGGMGFVAGILVFIVMTGLEYFFLR